MTRAAPLPSSFGQTAFGVDITFEVVDGLVEGCPNISHAEGLIA